MAATASAALQQGLKIAPVIQRTANKKVPALAGVPVVGPDDPSGPAWNIDTSTGTVRYHGEGADFAAGTARTYIRAKLDWGRMDHPIELTDEAIARARFGNPDGIQDLKGEALGEGIRDFLAKIQSEMFQGAGGANQIAGLHMSNDATGSYAGINQASVTDFAALVMSANTTTPGTAAALTKKRLRDFVAAVVERSEVLKEELVFFTHATGVNRVIDLYESQVNYTSQAMLGGVQPRVVFDGLNFIEAPQAAYAHPSDTSTKCSISAAYIDWSSPKRGLHWQVLPYPTDESKVILSGLPYGIQLVVDSTGAHASKWVLRTMLQLVNPNPKKGGVLNDILI